jgi:hypothetical protein
MAGLNCLWHVNAARSFDTDGTPFFSAARFLIDACHTALKCSSNDAFTPARHEPHSRIGSTLRWIAVGVAGSCRPPAKHAQSANQEYARHHVDLTLK